MAKGRFHQMIRVLLFVCHRLPLLTGGRRPTSVSVAKTYQICAGEIQSQPAYSVRVLVSVGACAIWSAKD